MSRSFDGGDVANKAGKLHAQLAVRLAKQPPIFAPRLSLIGVSLGLYSFQNPLINGGEAPPHVISAQAKQIDDFYAARSVH